MPNNIGRFFPRVSDETHAAIAVPMADKTENAECRFGRFRLDVLRRVLLVDGKPAKLGARAVDVLIALVLRRDRVVGKNDLFDLVWPGLIVEENNLQVHVSALRKLLGPQAIATIPGRGYQFVAPVDQDVANSIAPISPAARERVTRDRTNLPAQLPPLIGRQAEVEDVTARLRRHALVTLVGPGGIGKTRLALAVARACADVFPDGVWLIDFTALAKPEHVAATVARVLSISLSTKSAARSTIAAALRAQSMLLLLDNCEHVLEEVAALATAIRSHARNVRLLSTSQEPLKLADEQVVRLAPLALPPAEGVPNPATFADYGALQLFVARAQAVDHRLQLSSTNLATITEICRGLDGLPLAIELAAARLPLLGIEGVRERLKDRLQLFHSGSRDAPFRQQTLRAALDWSHALLGPAEQLVFRRLGVFVGGFSLELAQRVASDESIEPVAVLDHLGALIDKSLVVASGEARPRYRLLESAREFALEKMEAAGEHDVMRRRHAYAMRALMEDFDAAVVVEPHFDTLASRLEPEFDNLHAALAYSCAVPSNRETAIALVAASDWLWNEYVRFGEGLQWARRVAPWVDESAARPLRARFHLTFAGLCRVALRPASEWVDRARKALAEYRLLGDRVGLYRALCLLGGPSGQLIAGRDIGPLLDEAARLENPDWSPRLRLRRQNALEWWHDLGGRLAEARAAGRLHVKLARQAGGTIEIGALSNLADTEFALGNADEAIALCRESIKRARELGRLTAIFDTYGNMVPALLDRGDLRAAGDAIREGRASFIRGMGTAFVMLVPLAVLVQRHGDPELAASLIGCADRAYREGGQVMHPPERRMRERLLADLQAALSLRRIDELRRDRKSVV